MDAARDVGALVSAVSPPYVPAGPGSATRRELTRPPPAATWVDNPDGPSGAVHSVVVPPRSDQYVIPIRSAPLTCTVGDVWLAVLRTAFAARTSTGSSPVPR